MDEQHFTEADRQLLTKCHRMLSELFEILIPEVKSPETSNPSFVDEAQYRQAIAAFMHGDRKPLESYKKRGGMVPKRVRLVK